MKALDAVHEVARSLAAAGVPSPRTDAEHLVAYVAGSSRMELYCTDRALSSDEVGRLRSVQKRRRSREPLAYILGEWGFRRLTLTVDSRVLIPRPETEIVVERALEHLRALPAPRVLEVGTGSGAIALAIADEHPGAQVTAVDRSAGALAVAALNHERADVDGRVELLHGDLVAGLTGPFDLVVSNPPYVALEELEALQPEIRDWEPRGALVGEGFQQELARAARTELLVLEVAPRQAARVARELRELAYDDVCITQDLAGKERVVEGRR